MKVSELIEELQNFDPDMEVKFAYNYGDYWRTTVAQNIRTIDEQPFRHSEYHRMDRIVECEDDNDEGCRFAVVLS